MLVIGRDARMRAADREHAAPPRFRRQVRFWPPGLSEQAMSEGV
jgi:hypothetical protein